MPKKGKSDIKQKQTQKQIVNVNINQSKTTKRKTRTTKPKAPQTPLIYTYGSPSLGKPSDNLYYSRPPVIAQIIPAMGGDSSSILPPNNTSIENILQSIKNKTDKLMKPSKKLIDSGTQEIFNMEPKKKLNILAPEPLITVPRGIKPHLPNITPFKLTGEIVQRKHTDMQTDIPKRRPLTDTGSNEVLSVVPRKRRPLTDTGSNEVFNIPSETRDYKSVLNVANQEMKSLVKKVEKLSKKKETKPLAVPKDTQTETPPIKTVSSIATGVNITKPISHADTQTSIPKQKKLIFNPKKIETRKQLLKYKDLVPQNLITTSRKTTNYMNVQTAQPFVRSEKDKDLKDELKQKAHSMLSVSATMPQAFKPYPSLIQRKKKEPTVFEVKSLSNVADFNATKSKDALQQFTKINNMFNAATKSDKNMNDILQGVQMQNKVPDFIKKDTGGILETPQKQDKAANKIKKFIIKNYERKQENIVQEIAQIKPSELFGGTRSGAPIHGEAELRLTGKAIDLSIRDNFDKIRKIYDTQPKSYEDVKIAKKEIDKYKQNVQRIRKRTESKLTPDQMALKKDTIKEINDLQKKYKQIYEK